MVESEYDAIVIGSGAAGGIVACQIAEAGFKVLLLERGSWLKYEDFVPDHLRNHRLALYGHNLGPTLDGNPRVLIRENGDRVVLAPHQDGWNNNAMGVGGGTRIYGAQAWRFHPEDFRMASRYGSPRGGSLSDWPISYEDLEPYYDQAEYEIGVSGDSTAHGGIWPRKRTYPMPPVANNPRRSFLLAGAQRLGWQAGPVPLLINTIQYGGRPKCVQCGMCVGFPCPSESKGGVHNTVIPRALQTGNCTLLTEAQVERIEVDAQGKVNGISYFRQLHNGQIEHKHVNARLVVCSAGAIESARLLLLSRSSQHPSGLGNRYDQVGRNLQGHYYTGAFGQMDEVMEDQLGPGVSVATCQFNHGNPGVIGGAMLANEFTKLPIIFYKRSLPPDLPRWGAENKNYMREEYRRQIHVQGPVQEIPNPECRVQLDEKTVDRFGLPVVQLSGVVHEETVRTAEFIRIKAEEWLRASGANRVWSNSNGRYLSGGQHQAGTCRMGADPKSSVTDSFGRVHGHENLFVVDGSLHVTNGGFNPVLTIMALAYRSASEIVSRLF
jgi:choline dehydrogenase-like flavoprotein